MSKDPGWWSDWLISLLFASGILLIFKEGLPVTILLWIAYIGNGVKTVKAIPSEKNQQELFNHILIGIVVIVISVIVKIAALID